MGNRLPSESWPRLPTRIRAHGERALVEGALKQQGRDLGVVLRQVDVGVARKRSCPTWERSMVESVLPKIFFDPSRQRMMITTSGLEKIGMEGWLFALSIKE